jgi:hypothetical protein
MFSSSRAPALIGLYPHFGVIEIPPGSAATVAPLKIDHVIHIVDIPFAI